MIINCGGLKNEKHHVLKLPNLPFINIFLIYIKILITLVTYLGFDEI